MMMLDFDGNANDLGRTRSLQDECSGAIGLWEIFQAMFSAGAAIWNPVAIQS
jgi:hypothetical protein